jgi:hypothetical protein
MFNLPEKNPNFLAKQLKYEDTLEQFDDKTISRATLPGDLQMYEVKRQCQQIFGLESDSCEQNLDSECSVLWCKADRTEQMEGILCVTTSTKWADGTPCGIHESTVFEISDIFFY